MKRGRSNPPQSDRIIVASGTYEMQSPLVLSPQDSGSADFPISYEAAPGAKPVFSGARVLANWKRGENGLWTTNIPDAKSGAWNFEQLWVNGRRATRARTPNDFYFYATGKARPENAPTRGDAATLPNRAFVARAQDIAALKTLSPQELKDVTLVAYHSWESSRHHVAAIDWKSNTVVLGNAAPWPFFQWNAEQRYHLENFKAALDAPGEWFLERENGTLFYKPRADEDMTKARVLAPVAESFLQIQGRCDERKTRHRYRVQRPGISLRPIYSAAGRSRRWSGRSHGSRRDYGRRRAEYQF